ncbi:hypothetical protein TPHA_0L00880 [Tetrapisispora phaffii CBS 4417]|uniref:Sister chromatid cohesion protein n=1 Tax=Tetrapisispora phaffii (strain ATCC 24235 / CBS 4417 / NBRC 1672 / NRRL Y-8282 / UCD 70-5) TaxID=1071381 RepID=G8BZW7_TETPH|nr:hypothetical protein TPHA_0L00880 [Tetrapisispora phaffii CBS 4417]CCE65445.1 hypothetical protein TPHA_0L00880 [Tetrapisispora phaffii CBS 4417]
MVDYPGENTDIPKTISGTLVNQPLNYLIPKSAISDLIKSQLSISVPLEKATFARNNNNILLNEINIDLSTVGQDSNDPIIFKKPSNWSQMVNVKEQINKDDLTEGLSEFAIQLLRKNSGLLEKIPIRNVEEMNKLVKSHAREEIDDIYSSFNTESDASPKKLKLSSDISINQNELTQQYFKELKSYIDIIENQREMAKDEENYNHNYFKLPNGTYVLNENFVSQIDILITNISNTSTGRHQLEKSASKIILNELIANIENIKEEFLDFGSEHEILYKTVAYTSIFTIFTLLQMHYEDSQFHLEKYILVPLNYLKERIYSINNNDTLNEISSTELSMLFKTINQIPEYIKRYKFIGEELATVLNYVFSELVMNFEVNPSNIKAQHYWVEIKEASVNVLVALFQYISNQRIFIIEYLITHMENLPLKRTQKKLRKIANNVYISDFTIAIAQMLESIQQGSFNNHVSDLNNDVYLKMVEEYKENMKEIATLIDHIHSIIIDKFKENPSDVRHVLSNYITDLLIMLPNSSWPIAEELLSSIMKRLLLIFEPNSNHSAVVESMALQLLNSIGTEIFALKCSTKSTETYNLIEVFNSPKELPSYLKRFRLCINSIDGSTIGKYGKNYLFNKFIFILVRLNEYENENEASDALIEIPEMIKNELNNNIILGSKQSKKPESVKEAYCSILHSFELLNLYDLYLKLVVSLLSKDKIKLRSTAIRCLSSLASKDQNILTSPAVKETIIERLLDSSASVKDAILDLVNRGSAALYFYKQINHNYDDDSLLVRKHVLKINEELYDITNDIEIKIFVASRILLKLEDEEDAIIDMAKQILLKKWIFAIVESQDHQERQSEICDSVLQVMAGVATKNEKCNELYDWFLNFFLLEKAEHSNVISKQITDSLNKLTDTLVNSIVELQSIDIEDPKIKSQKWNYLNLLAKFSDSVVTFITKDHIIALYPYMLTNSQSTLQYFILCVFKDLMGKLDNFKPKFLYDMETILLSKLPKMSVKETEEAIPLGWYIAEKRNDYSRISKACTSCFSHIVPFINKATTEPESVVLENKLQRLIYLATGFARFCDSKILSEKIPYLKENEYLFEYVAKCLLVLSNKKIEHVIRRISIKNLIKLCSSHPRLFNSRHILNIFDEELKTGPADIQLVLIEGLYDFFIQEEKKSIREVGVSRSISSTFHLRSKVNKTKRASHINDGLCSALVSRFLKYILNICLSSDTHHSIVALRCIRVILQFGYTNPSHCIPVVIGALSSKNPHLHKLSTKILNDLADKYETMIFNNISQGINIAADYSYLTEESNCYSNDKTLRDLQVILKDGKSNSSKFFKTVMKILNKHISNITHANLEEEELRKFVFICTNISMLEFPTFNELLTLMKFISVSAEQIRELIIDEINDIPSKMTLEEGYKNAIKTEYTLRNLNLHLIKMYELRKDILLLDESEEQSLKTKAINLPENIELVSYARECFNIMNSTTQREFYNEYLATIEDEE